MLDFEKSERHAFFSARKHFDMMLTGRDIGAPKPAQDIFRRAMAHPGDGNAENYVMVGNLLAAAIVGASGVEIRSMWYAPHGGATKMELSVAPEWTVRSNGEEEKFF